MPSGEGPAEPSPREDAEGGPKGTTGEKLPRLYSSSGLRNFCDVLAQARPCHAAVGCTEVRSDPVSVAIRAAGGWTLRFFAHFQARPPP
jgi:hypothetical protein